MTDTAYYADDLAFLVYPQAPAPAEYRLYSHEQAAGGVGLNKNANKIDQVF